MDVNLRPGRKIKRPFEEKCAAGFIPGAVLLGLFLVWFLEFRDWNLMDSFVGSLVEIGCFVLCGLILCGWWITVNYTSYAPIDYMPPLSEGKTEGISIAEMKTRKRPDNVSDEDSDFDDDVDSSDSDKDEEEMEKIEADKVKKAQETFNSERWCFSCKAYKPPRCHHCTACGRCVLRSDHHCEC